MEAIYNDYASWILEQSSLIDELTKLNSPLLKTDKHVLDVVKYLYDKAINENNLSGDEETIFTTGFYYLFEHFDQINLILENHFDHNINELHKYSKTMLLLLDLIDLENELYNLVKEEDELTPLIELEDEIIGHLSKKEEAPETLFEKVNVVTEKAFDKVSDDFYPIKEIFYDIADEYDLL